MEYPVEVMQKLSDQLRAADMLWIAVRNALNARAYTGVIDEETSEALEDAVENYTRAKGIGDADA